MRAGPLLLLLILAAGCNTRPPEPDPCLHPPTFGVDILPLVQATCLDCHSTTRTNSMTRKGAPSELNFDSYELVQPNRDAFVDAVTAGRQPPVSVVQAMPLTTDDRDKFDLWRSCGFKP